MHHGQDFTFSRCREHRSSAPINTGQVYHESHGQCVPFLFYVLFERVTKVTAMSLLNAVIRFPPFCVYGIYSAIEY